MDIAKRNLTQTFKEFFASEKSGGVLLIVCTVISLAVTNSVFGKGYLASGTPTSAA